MFRVVRSVLKTTLAAGLHILLAAGLLAAAGPGCATAEEAGATPPEANAPAKGEPAGSAPAPQDPPTASTPADGDRHRSERPSIGLDSLLRPRGELRIEPREEVLDLRAGRDRETWYREYQEALEEVDALDEVVDATQERMRGASGGSVTYSPIGAAETHDPEVVKLRAELKRDRQSLDTAKSRLREIEVEASLGEVPDHWLHEAPVPGS